MAPLFGTEISFRLPGPGAPAQAQAVADRLARAAAGSRRHALFTPLEGDGYGCLAEWPSEREARAYLDRPAVDDELGALAARCGRPPSVRLYAIREQAPG